MCGIIGYIGQRKTAPILINGLAKLEYRGYDSAGICVLEDQELKTIKKKGMIAELAKDKNINNLSAVLGIAHTRWATHGEPNERNAHPHFDCDGNIAIVHNGIIENHQALKKLLEKHGHKIKSDTDSEIIAHLIEKFYKDDLEEAVIQALNLIEGAFGLAALHKNENRIVVARRGSPLIIGVGDGEMFVASDIPAILEYTKRVIYLNDDELAVIEKDKYQIKKLTGENVDKEIHEIKWTVDQIAKQGYKYFMLKEIFEQPEALLNTLRGRIKENQIKISVDLDITKIKRIIIVACGTSWHSALIGKYLLELITGIKTEVDYASEFRYRQPIVDSDDLMIVISQSGETADTLAALKEAKKKGAKTLGIVNAVGSTITREVDTGIYLHAGPEIGVASTKAFTSQVLALIIFALNTKQNQGEKIDKEIIRELANIPDKISQALKQDKKIIKLADKFKDAKNFLYLGRGFNFPVALEGALKLKEISYIHAEGYPAAEIKHGPIALIDKNMPVVFIATKSNLSQKIISNMQEVKSRNGIIIALVNKGDKDIKKIADHVIEVPETLDEFSPIINVIPLQLLAYHIADLKNLNVDKPRNLAKSVTVE
ncbi:MAG: glutamine--fructose-6-phosphate transaminase (isomerizing) [Candidatus Komeilibacteria bacterium]|jgi:glutamine---fructose-6-phosphate transaminase (isomerizing)|nr:glutamine--fructose-6-phosphate transaminase (isomerizing) [Candidatus Komeilibacteria bacterium]MBT4447497.1 glutamine--fructose-6-phosphate transaminase (isomerizing) [Candidatus Komeilibacteria bacterium]